MVWSSVTDWYTPFCPIRTCEKVKTFSTFPAKRPRVRKQEMNSPMIFFMMEDFLKDKVMNKRVACRGALRKKEGQPMRLPFLTF